MKNYIIKLIINSLAVIATAYILPSAHVDGFITALIVAVLLSFFNGFVKPILKVLSFPITLLTLGLFLLIINAAMVSLVDFFIIGFLIDGFFCTIIFSLILSIFNYILEKIFN